MSILQRAWNAFANPQSFWRGVLRHGLLDKRTDPASWMAFRHEVDRLCAMRRGQAKGLRMVSVESLFPGIRGQEAALRLIPATSYNISWEELLTLCLLVRAMSPSVLFEFGTFDGRTTLHLALNSAKTAVIHTLDIQGGEFSFGSDAAYFQTLRVGEHFLDSPERAKIQMHAGDSRALDFRPFSGAVDFIFIDGDHAFKAVLSDSQAAFSMARPGGIVVWHDYRLVGDVTRALVELAADRDLVNLEGTSLVVWRAG